MIEGTSFEQQKNFYFYVWIWIAKLKWKQQGHGRTLVILTCETSETSEKVTPSELNEKATPVKLL